MRTWLLAALLLPMGVGAADLLSPLFQDHAVLQRDRPVRLWGDAPPGSEVTVEIAGQRATAQADRSGEWHLSLSPLPAGGPHVLTARSSSGEAQTLRDVLIGDVWLCSGQSNMEMPMRFVSNSIASSSMQLRMTHSCATAGRTARSAISSTTPSFLHRLSSSQRPRSTALRRVAGRQGLAARQRQRNACDSTTPQHAFLTALSARVLQVMSHARRAESGR